MSRTPKLLIPRNDSNISPPFIMKLYKCQGVFYIQLCFFPQGCRIGENLSFLKSPTSNSVEIFLKRSQLNKLNLLFHFCSVSTSPDPRQQIHGLFLCLWKSSNKKITFKFLCSHNLSHTHSHQCHDPERSNKKEEGNR